METQEIWKDVKGYEGRYQVSNYGRIKSLNYHLTGKSKILKPYINPHGYHMYVLTKKRKRWFIFAHRLVYMTFVADIPAFNKKGIGNERMEINHIDKNKSNNAVWNLELVSHIDNVNHSSSKKVYQFTLDGKLVKVWQSTAECGRNGFNFRDISLCCIGKRKTHKGFKWSYNHL